MSPDGGGSVFAQGECCCCHRWFNFDPELVPSLSINGKKGPVCRQCVELANPARIEKGLPPIVPLPGAYEQTAPGYWLLPFQTGVLPW